MKLVNGELGITLELLENRSNVMVVENPVILRKVIEDLIGQSSGEPGNFVLSTDNVPISIVKHLELIVDPFNLDFNSKKIQNRVYELIKEGIDNNLTERFAELNHLICEFMDLALSDAPFSVDYDVELDPIGLLKLYHVNINNKENSLLDNIIEYIRIQSRLMTVNTLAFLNLKGFLTRNEIEQVYAFAYYNKINLLLIERCNLDKLDSEKVIIIDKDQCIISY